MITSIHVDAATTAWGIDASQQRYVLRRGTTVETFPYVDHDGLYIRAISRVGFGFLNPAGVIHIAQNASWTVTINGSPTGGSYTVLVNGFADRRYRPRCERCSRQGGNRCRRQRSHRIGRDGTAVARTPLVVRSRWPMARIPDRRHHPLTTVAAA